MKLPIILMIITLCIAFAAFFILMKPKWKNKVENDKYSDLKASVLFLFAAFPTLLFLLTLFGLSSYDSIINKVAKDLQIDNKLKMIDKSYNNILSIDSASTNIYEEITMELNKSKQAFLNLNTSILNIFPKGTIVPYNGKSDGYDKSYWAICNGKNGTPDLTGRFILGAKFNEKNLTGDSNKHTHNIEGAFKGKIKKIIVDEYSSAQTSKQKGIEADTHEHELEIDALKIVESEHLPPFYKLVYLMKIK